MTDSIPVLNQDTNIGPIDYYSVLDDNQLLVSSIKYSIQGEGIYSGWPAFIISLAGCNRGRKHDMGCRFCRHAFFFGDGQRLRFAEITTAMRSMMPRPDMYYPLVVITGGEPMLQDNLTGFLVHLYGQEFYEVQIETNGDRLPRGFLENQIMFSSVSIMVSPKAVVNYLPLPWPVYNNASYLKISVSGDPSSPYYNIPDYAADFAFGINGKPVYLSPIVEYKCAPLAGGSAWDVGMIDVEKTKANFKRAREIALMVGFRLSISTDMWFCAE